MEFLFFGHVVSQTFRFPTHASGFLPRGRPSFFLRLLQHFAALRSVGRSLFLPRFHGGCEDDWTWYSPTCKRKNTQWIGGSAWWKGCWAYKVWHVDRCPLNRIPSYRRRRTCLGFVWTNQLVNFVTYLLLLCQSQRRPNRSRDQCMLCLQGCRPAWWGWTRMVERGTSIRHLKRVLLDQLGVSKGFGPRLAA